MALEEIKTESLTETKTTPETKNSNETSVNQDNVEKLLLEGLKDKYDIDKEEFDKLMLSNEVTTRINELKKEIKNGNSVFIYQEVEKLFSEHISSLVEKGEFKISLEKLTEGVDSGSLDNLTKYAEELINKRLEKYDFIDETSKDVITYNIFNDLLKDGIGDNIKALSGGIDTLFADINSKGINFLNDLLSDLEKQHDGSVNKGSLTSIELFNTVINKYTNKLDLVNEKFNEKNKSLTEAEGGTALSVEEKKGIFSNIDFFRNPHLLSKINDLDIKDLNIDFSKTQLNKEGLNPKEAKEFSKLFLESREALVNLTKTLDKGEKTMEGVLKLANNGVMGAGMDKLMEMLLKMPILGKFLAGFLGLDLENPIEDYGDSKRGFTFMDSLKKMGDHNEFKKDGETKKQVEVKGFGAFEGKKVEIDFSENKDELIKLSKLFPSVIKTKEINDFWTASFSENGYTQEEKPTFKLEGLDEAFKTDTKLDNKEFNKMLNDAMSKYEAELNKDTSSKTTNTSKDSQNTGTDFETEVKNPETSETPKYSQEAIDLLKGKHKGIVDNNFTGFGDYFQFTNMDLKQFDKVKNNNDEILNLLEKELGKKDNWKDNKDIVVESINIIFNFIKDNKGVLNNGTLNINALKLYSKYNNYLNGLNTPNKESQTSSETTGQ